MKRVPTLEDEPAELAQWRADNPADDGSLGADAKDAWERLKSSGAHRTVVELLLELQQGLCGYCEQRICDNDGRLVVNDYQVEHVLAKSGGAGRVLAWRNFLLCCGGGTWKHHKDITRYDPSGRSPMNVSCGQAKGDANIDCSCDPRSLPWREPVVRIDVDGRLRPDEAACTRAGIDPAVLGHVVDVVLSLNCERLRVARRKEIQNLDGWLTPLVDEILASSHLSAGKRALALQLHIEGRLGPDRNGYLRRFWTTERLYLREEAEAWIRDNATRLRFR